MLNVMLKWYGRQRSDDEAKDAPMMGPDKGTLGLVEALICHRQVQQRVPEGRQFCRSDFAISIPLQLA